MSTRNLADEELTQAVLSSFSNCSSERFQEIMQSLVRHLHAFASEVELTEEEWFAGIDFLTRTGHITDDKRQEFILLSDVLGLSMLVVGMNHRKPAGRDAVDGVRPVLRRRARRGSKTATTSQTALPASPAWCRAGWCRSPASRCAGAHMEVWEADDDGFYDVQHAGLEEPRGRGHLYSEHDGRYWFWAVKPTGYPIPGDGPVGDLLARGEPRPDATRPRALHGQRARL